MPNAHEHDKIFTYLNITYDDFLNFDNRPYAWGCVILFYQAVHAIEKFRYNIRSSEIDCSKINFPLNYYTNDHHSHSHYYRKKFLHSLFRKNIISIDLINKYDTLKDVSETVRYKSTSSFVRKFLLICCSGANGDYLSNNINKIQCMNCRKIQNPSVEKIDKLRELLREIINELIETEYYN